MLVLSLKRTHAEESTYGRTDRPGAAGVGAKVGDLIRRRKKKYGGLQVNEARRLKALEEENRQLKRLVADQALNLQVVKDLLGQKW